ncbi:MAG TPA: glutamate--tRNA ligase family protein [Candidatus Paceibacterota bacterium]
MSNSDIRVRIPPSPTGYCHVGTARTALLNFLFARKNSGRLILRIEDTDKERSTPEFEKDIIDSITWLGIEWDEFYRQSERMDIYKEKLHALIDSRKAYLSEEESKKEAGKITKVVRLKNPGSAVTFNDLVRGDISFDTKELGDFVIARNIDEPLYHFAVVVDDEEMHISHVIRGEDHISNTPRQILIQEAFGFKRPQYAHFPLNLAQDRSKLSKRKGDVSVRSYREKGYLPEALLNYLAVIGWTPPSGKEILSLEEMIKEFDISGIHKSGSVFDIDKLRWFNRHYLLAMPNEKFGETAIEILKEGISGRGLEWSDSIGLLLVPIIRERISVWDDLRELIRNGEFDFFFADPRLSAVEIPDKKSSTDIALKHLNALNELLSAIPLESFKDAETIKNAIWEMATKEGRAAVLWPFRYSLTGRTYSPDPFIVAAIIGKESTLKRVEGAISILRGV